MASPILYLQTSIGRNSDNDANSVPINMAVNTKRMTEKMQDNLCSIRPLHIIVPKWLLQIYE